MKKSGKKKKDPELTDYCEACLRIRNSIFDPHAISLENPIPHTCCDVNDEFSKERIRIDVEIAELLKFLEEGLFKNGKEEMSQLRSLRK